MLETKKALTMKLVPDVLLFLVRGRRSFLPRAKEHVKLWFRILIFTVRYSGRDDTTF